MAPSPQRSCDASVWGFAHAQYHRPNVLEQFVIGSSVSQYSFPRAGAELAAGGRVVTAVSVPVGSGGAAHGAAQAAQSPRVGASSPGPAISGGGDSPSSLNSARSRLAGPSGVLAAVEDMAGLTCSDLETCDLIRIWAADRDLLDGTSRNNKVYESMAAQMRCLGYLRTTLQVKEKMKRLRKEYKYDKCSRKIATYHDALATVLAQGSKGSSLFIKSEVDESMGSEEFLGTDSEANYIEKRRYGLQPGQMPEAAIKHLFTGQRLFLRAATMHSSH
ncbi:hypothetical protein HPB51_009636 [Rhipicephalus microplus]|uniref:Myb/SANT-like DNA-binding domain-containing protein n=1 Tax=Rhipicephalus microplus TaxID=6941 RepID=A0A9J6D9B7_RHIMP|nr:hypothetical protein HPB51_009636 [Rhipicephalus microplus]